MLETDDVDDDYFIPTASTSLANIFIKPTEKDENESLKYTAPKPQNANAKSTACVFACALQGYEWFNNVYTAKGKLGFAVVKILQSGLHNMILYDANKTTLSSALASSKLEVSLKGKNYICYYDNQRKYWSLYGSDEDIKKIVELLKEFHVVIKQSQDGETPPEHLPENTKSARDTLKNQNVDTDSSSNKDNKAAIINRMATVGHSVLPQKGFVLKSTDTETDDSDTQIKPVKPKPKIASKRNITSKIIETNKKIEHPEHSTDIEQINTYNNHDQIISLPTTSLITTPSSNEMNLFVTEQRISNTEIRMNMARIADKVDLVLTKMNDLHINNSSSINTEIMQKLLREYENKIKVYEELLSKEKGNTKQDVNAVADNDLITLRNRISDLENIIKEKNDYVLSLKNEIQALKDRHDSNESKQNKCVLDLEQELSVKNEKLSQLTKEIEDLTNTLKKDLETKIKVIMNETFQAISSNFENDQTYSGESVKALIANVLKEVTMKSLKE